MRISFMDDEPQIFPQQYGGKARTIINLAEYFSGRPEVENVSILSSSIEHTKDEFKWHNIHFKKLNDYGVLPTLRKEAQEADILSIHNCSIAFPRLENSKAALIYHLHDVLVSDADRGSHLDKALAGEWDALIAPSSFAAEVFLAFGQNLGNLTKPIVIPRGLNSEMFQPIDKDAALTKIKQMHPSQEIGNGQYPLVFLPWRGNAGKGEEFLDYLSKALREKYKNYLILTTFDTKSPTSDKRIINVGWIDSALMKYFYSAANVVVSFSTLPESFSQICIEAIACGTPFLCFGFGNLAELAKALPAVILCQPTPEGIASGINETLNLENKAVTESQTIIRKTYDMDKVGQTYLKLFQRLIKNKTPLSHAPKFFLSPYCRVTQGTAYLTTKLGIKEYGLGVNELKVLTACTQPKSKEDLMLTTSLDDVTIDIIISSLGGNELLLHL